MHAYLEALRSPALARRLGLRREGDELFRINHILRPGLTRLVLREHQTLPFRTRRSKCDPDRVSVLEWRPMSLHADILVLVGIVTPLLVVLVTRLDTSPANKGLLALAFSVAIGVATCYANGLLSTVVIPGSVLAAYGAAQLPTSPSSGRRGSPRGCLRTWDERRAELVLAFIVGALVGASIVALGVAACAAGSREDACRACLACRRRG